MAERAQIIVKGIVQGVGFRPYVFNLAESLRLKGYVTNTAEGVRIEVEGPSVHEFVRRLPREAPPLARVTDVFVTTLPLYGFQEFSIQKSADTGTQPFTLVSPDVSICPDCLKELLDPSDRRYLYPFINCTNCGPRYSITRRVPYDRPNTTMSVFEMCPACRQEYNDPRNRRFHAQPNACPSCGPRVEFRMRNSECGIKGKDAMVEVIKVLRQGGVMAIKGLGGFHLACDAANDQAVKRLRERKRKSNKPFAVMVPTVEAAAQFSLVSDLEKDALQSIRRPAVLLAKKENIQILSEAVSPQNRFIGVMLPYTPLHYLLFYHPLDTEPSVKDSHFSALVMTSGNISEEPIVCDNKEAISKLSHLVDGFLFHDRDIFMRVDDSVIRLRTADCGLRIKESNPLQSEIRNPKSAMSFIRRSRGFTPDPIELADDGPEVLACGADLKNTFTITKGRFAIPSQHIGDMENYETVKFFEESLKNIKTVYRADPKIVVHDLHPGYLSTQWATEFGVRNAECGVSTIGIQHHYAHIGSVMAEHGLKGKVIGIAFDGTGYGTDGHLWGGEFLIADVDGFERVGQLKYVALPGGETAIREPWRTAVGMIAHAAGGKAADRLEQSGFVQRFGRSSVEQVVKVARSAELSPLASGAGRLFDAVAALLGVCDRNTFEGEAAMALEALTIDGIEDEYPVELKVQNGYTVIDFGPCLLAITDEMIRAISKNEISTKFHNSVSSVIKRCVIDLKKRLRITDVVLGGGTFQNLYLLNKTVKTITSSGMHVYVNQKVPCNDGGLSLGQAYLVRERLKNEGI